MAMYKKGRPSVNKNRNAIEIMAKILSLANPEAKATYIMYGANLNHELLQKYIQLLMENGLLKKEGNVYSRTEKGTAFLLKYKELKSYIEKETNRSLFHMF
jgi:predicted transcriptional regulator